MDLLKGLSLFSGIGGIDLGLREWVQPVAYCEIEPYCQSVLLQRMSEGYLPKAPIWDDIRTLSSGNSDNESSINIIYGGFPCQDISVAGRGAGLEGERSGLFFEIMRLAQEIKPRFIFLENSNAITTRGGLEVIRSLTSIGYSCRWISKTAQEEGSPQLRKRWFCLAYSHSKSGIKTDSQAESFEIEERTRLRSSRQDRGGTSLSYWDENKSPVFGVDDGIPFRMDRAKSLGNSVCIQQTRAAFKELIGID